MIVEKFENLKDRKFADILSEESLKYYADGTVLVLPKAEEDAPQVSTKSVPELLNLAIHGLLKVAEMGYQNQWDSLGLVMAFANYKVDEAGEVNGTTGTLFSGAAPEGNNPVTGLHLAVENLVQEHQEVFENVLAALKEGDDVQKPED